MQLQIKNMVCDRCKMAVASQISGFGLTAISVELGEVEIEESLSEAQKSELNSLLKAIGFEIIEDRKTRQAEKIKNLITELVHQNRSGIKTNLSDFLSSKIPQDYSALSQTFSQTTGTTIEQYYILQKIERAKELLEYGELNLNEIAFALNYSSASHLARQFKKTTGLTPSEFKASKTKRIPLNRL